MDFDEYQRQASTTAVYPGQGGFVGLAYAALGLNGEAGETGEQVKKLWRDEMADTMDQVLSAIDRFEDDGTLSYDWLRQRVQDAFSLSIEQERRDKMLKELGDTLWYAAQVATELGADLSVVAQMNIDKLAERRRLDLIHGEGSDR